MNNLKQEEQLISLFSKAPGLPQRSIQPPIQQLLDAFYSKIKQLGRVTENQVYLWPNIRMYGATPTVSRISS